MECHRNIKARIVPSETFTEQDRNDENDLEMIMHSNYEWSSTNIPKLQPIDQYLYLLQIVKNEIQIVLGIPNMEEIASKKKANKTVRTKMTKSMTYMRIDSHKEFF